MAPVWPGNGGNRNGVWETTELYIRKKSPPPAATAESGVAYVSRREGGFSIEMFIR